jgi:hypothetical protein
MSVTIRDINSAIISGVFTNNDLTSILEAVKFARSQLGRQKAREFKAGDTVKFTSNRNGVTYTGKVDRVKLKFALVTTGYQRFNVPLTMLESV